MNQHTFSCDFVFHSTALLHWIYQSLNGSNVYRIVASASQSRFEAHIGLFRLLIKGIFDPFEKKFIFWLLTCISTRNFKVHFQKDQHYCRREAKNHRECHG